MHEGDRASMKGFDVQVVQARAQPTYDAKRRRSLNQLLVDSCLVSDDQSRAALQRVQQSGSVTPYALALVDFETGQRSEWSVYRLSDQYAGHATSKGHLGRITSCGSIS